MIQNLELVDNDRRAHTSTQSGKLIAPREEHVWDPNTGERLTLQEYERDVLGLRDVSTAERQALAKKGHTFKGTSYPIKNCGDVSNARQALGRSKPGDRAALRAFINRRANALGCNVTPLEDPSIRPMGSLKVMAPGQGNTPLKQGGSLKIMVDDPDGDGDTDLGGPAGTLKVHGTVDTDTLKPTGSVSVRANPNSGTLKSPGKMNKPATKSPGTLKAPKVGKPNPKRRKGRGYQAPVNVNAPYTKSSPLSETVELAVMAKHAFKGALGGKCKKCGQSYASGNHS